MEARVSVSSSRNDWQELYKAALFEDDEAKIPQRVAEAEKAVCARAAELFDAEENQVREQQAVENAKYFLRLLRKTEARTETSDAAPIPQHVG